MTVILQTVQDEQTRQPVPVYIHKIYVADNNHSFLLSN